MNRFQIKDADGEVINTIVADQAFVDEAYPGRWELLPEPDPIPTPPTYRSLTKIEFVEHVQATGGMTDAMLVSAYDDPNLRALWIKLDFAGGVERDHPATVAGLEGITALGYLPNGAQAVLDAWLTV